VKSLLLAAATVALVAAGCGGGSTTDETSPPPPSVTVTTESAGAPAPAIEGTTVDGEQLALADFRGRAVFVNVWASW
jgi:ABC-type glycerol-3-phosphate transport system substrate-binding protein